MTAALRKAIDETYMRWMVDEVILPLVRAPAPPVE